jgi:uncharacterized protein (TIGR02391 family)
MSRTPDSHTEVVDTEPTGLEALLTNIQQLQAIMVAVATGGPRIQDKEAEYSQLYVTVGAQLESLEQLSLALPNPNPFHSLWDWYGHWSANLPSYASRRQYVRELYAPVADPIRNALHKHRVAKTSAAELMADLDARLAQEPQSTSPAFAFTFNSLHPKIAQRCRVAFETGQYDDSIFNAMKVVEEEIRGRIGAPASAVGVSLVSGAMGARVPRLIFSEVSPEQDAAHALYRGAIGSFKNPLSHRFLDTDDPIKTFELLAFASLLMRMLDTARDAP